MQLTTVAASSPLTVAADAPTTSNRLGGIGKVKRGIFTKAVDLVFGSFASNHASIADAIAAAKQLSAGRAPAAVVAENLFTDQGSRDVPAEQRFSVYTVDYQLWKASRGGQLEQFGPYHHGEFSRTKGYELEADAYSDGTPHEAVVLVDDGHTWDNGVAPRS